MTTIAQNPSCCSRTKVLIVLIEDDIDGLIEDEDDDLIADDIELTPEEIVDEVEVVLEDPVETEVDSLHLWAYERAKIDLKYFRVVSEDERWFVEGQTKLILATSETDDPGEPETGDERKIVRYATTSVFYDDGKPFKVGEYGREDYADYDENSPWPPPDLPVGFLKKRYRGIVINGVLITPLCEQLPPPPLPEE